MISEQQYWNPVLETLAQGKIRKLQLKKFRKIFEWTYDHSKFHRKLYDEAGITPQDIRSFEDIRRVPTVEKSMMRDIQRKAPFPYGDALCGWNAGHIFYGPRGIVPATGFLFLSGITSLWPSGPVIMPLKRSAVKSSREGCWTPKPGF